MTFPDPPPSSSDNPFSRVRGRVQLGGYPLIGEEADLPLKFPYHPAVEPEQVTDPFADDPDKYNDPDWADREVAEYRVARTPGFTCPLVKKHRPPDCGCLPIPREELSEVMNGYLNSTAVLLNPQAEGWIAGFVLSIALWEPLLRTVRDSPSGLTTGSLTTALPYPEDPTILRARAIRYRRPENQIGGHWDMPTGAAWLRIVTETKLLDIVPDLLERFGFAVEKIEARPDGRQRGVYFDTTHTLYR